MIHTPPSGINGFLLRILSRGYWYAMPSDYSWSHFAIISNARNSYQELSRYKTTFIVPILISNTCLINF